MDRTFDQPSQPARPLTGFERGLSFAALMSILGVWALAAFLSPDPRGIGTHEQLGLAPCRMIAFFGIPCAFCGMTTAFTHLAHGNFITAFLTQPAAVVFAGVTIPAAFVAAMTTVQGAVPASVSALTTSRRTMVSLLVIVLAAWIYKVATYL